jgi:hypothetical protein
VKPIAVVIPLGADGSSLLLLAGQAAAAGPQVSTQPFAGARPAGGGAQVGAQLGDLGGQPLEFAGLGAAELFAEFEPRPQVGWRFGRGAGDRRGDQGDGDQGGEASGELGGGEAGLFAQGRASGELLGDGEAEPLDRHAAGSLERVELVGGGVEHGGELVVVWDRHRLVEPAFA